MTNAVRVIAISPINASKSPKSLPESMRSSPLAVLMPVHQFFAQTHEIALVIPIAFC
jgi:hypothetical protein